MEDKPQYIDDSNREALIQHWELRLSDSSHAVYVAQQQLDKLYRQRYCAVAREIGSVTLQVAQDEAA